jgi:hypothetical protein
MRDCHFSSRKAVSKAQHCEILKVDFELLPIAIGTLRAFLYYLQRVSLVTLRQVVQHLERSREIGNRFGIGKSLRRLSSRFSPSCNGRLRDPGFGPMPSEELWLRICDCWKLLDERLCNAAM